MENIRNLEENKLSLRYGLLIGAISVVISIVFRIVDPLLLFVNYWIQILSFIIVIVLLVVLAIDVRRKVGGYWTFGEGYKSLIIMSVFITLITIIYGFILFKFIDPDMPKKVTDALADVTSTRLSNAGLDQSKIDEYMKPFNDGEVQAKMEPSFKNELTSFGVALLIYAIIDLIIAACIQKRRPLFVADDPSA